MLRYERSQNKWGMTQVTIYHGDTVVLEWSDSESESPEDLIWDRRISEIFQGGVEAGRLESLD